MIYEEIVSKVAASMGLNEKTVDRIYRAYWKAVKKHISTLPLKQDLSDNEFLQLQPNVNIPSIGKLYVTLDRYKKLKKKYQKLTMAQP